MGRTPTPEKVLATTYNEAVRYIRSKGKNPVPRQELCGALSCTPSRLSASLKYGRNAFAEGRMEPKYWIMGGPKGYTLPYDDDKVLAAYVMQNVKDIRSRTRTQKPLYDYVLCHCPETLTEAFAMTKGFKNARLDMNPWEAYNDVLEAWGYTVDDFEDSEDEWEETE